MNTFMSHIIEQHLDGGYDYLPQGIVCVFGRTHI